MSIKEINQKTALELIKESAGLERALASAISRHDPQAISALAEFDPKSVKSLLTARASSSLVELALFGGLLLQPSANAFPFTPLVIDKRKGPASRLKVLRLSKNNMAHWGEAAWEAKRATVEALEAVGLDLTPKMGHKMAKSALWTFGAGVALGWIASRGWLSQVGLQGLMSSSGMEALYACFETESKDVLKVLEELIGRGVIEDKAPSPGWTDFAGSGQSHSADLLKRKGFLPREAVVYGNKNSHPPTSAFGSWVRGEFDPDLEVSVRIGPKVGSMKERLAPMGWLAEHGALSGVSAPEDIWALVPGLRSKPAGPAKSATIPFMHELARHTAPPGGHSDFWALATRGACLGADVSVLVEALALAGGSVDPTGAFCGLVYGGSQKKQFATLSLICAAGFDPKRVSMDCSVSKHPVAAAYKDGNGGLARALLDAGVPLAWRDPETGETVLHMLASKDRPAGRVELSKVLARPGANALVNVVGLKKAGGATALMRACARLDVEAAGILLDAGADPNIQDSKGEAALHWVGRSNAKSKHERAGALVSLLIKRGADPGVKNNAGKSPAQKIAGHAALSAVSALVHAKLDELCGAGPMAQRAQSLLASRGAEGLSVAERAAFAHEANAVEGAHVPKKARVRL